MLSIQDCKGRLVRNTDRNVVCMITMVGPDEYMFITIDSYDRGNRWYGDRMSRTEVEIHMSSGEWEFADDVSLFITDKESGDVLNTINTDIPI